jgi:8-oxo-dGTP pyrophosphatase MutT (NUDIX family)
MRSLTLGAPAEGIIYEKRNAARCLIIRDDQICIVHVKKGISLIHHKLFSAYLTPSKGNYYKLPGGGLESEDPNDFIACQREALEETGCEVIVRLELIAQTTEYRGTLHQESRAYICNVVQDTGKVELTELEASEGLVHFWCPTDGALENMRSV